MLSRTVSAVTASNCSSSYFSRRSRWCRRLPEKRMRENSRARARVVSPPRLRCPRVDLFFLILLWAIRLVRAFAGKKYEEEQLDGVTGERGGESIGVARLEAAATRSSE